VLLLLKALLSPLKLTKNSKRLVAFIDKPFESWNKAKSKLSEVDYNKRRRTDACINCGEVRHKSSECTMLKS